VAKKVVHQHFGQLEEDINPTAIGLAKETSFLLLSDTYTS
jgi:hypothetical protein